MKTFYKVFGALLVLVVIVFAVSKVDQPAVNSYGSVGVGGEYHATTTYNSSGAPTFATSQLLISNTSGTLGSVIITGAVAGAMVFKDATSTTDLSAVTIATFPASTAAGTYTFDATLFRGLVVTTSAGLAPTTTITFRNN